MISKTNINLYIFKTVFLFILNKQFVGFSFKTNIQQISIFVCIFLLFQLNKYQNQVEFDMTTK